MDLQEVYLDRLTILRPKNVLPSNCRSAVCMEGLGPGMASCVHIRRRDLLESDYHPSPEPQNWLVLDHDESQIGLYRYVRALAQFSIQKLVVRPTSHPFLAS